MHLFTDSTVKIQVFWDVNGAWNVKIRRRFGGSPTLQMTPRTFPEHPISRVQMVIKDYE